MHAVTVSGGPAFGCADDDTVLRAGLRAGLGFPYECNSGNCGTCKVEVVSGETASLRPGAPGLAERDRARNRVLACQAQPLTDCEIKVRLREENVPRHRPARFRATLAQARDLTHDMREFRFSTGGAPGFLPGQYALFYLPGLAAPRTYSMANVHGAGGEWHFIVRRVPEGVGTGTLFNAVVPGSEIALDGPYGLAYLRPESPRELVCVAGGSGLAPILSVVRGAVSDPRLDGRGIHVFHGVRTARDLCARAELEALPGFGTRVRLEEVVSEPSADPSLAWAGPTGFVHERVRDFLGDRHAAYEYYFAGPPPMVEAVQRILMDARVPFPQVHFDRFF